MARRRYQRGYLYLRGRRTLVWVGRWREDVMRSDGSVQRIRRSLVIGTRADFPTRRLAERHFETLLARVNAPSYRPGRIASLLGEFAVTTAVVLCPSLFWYPLNSSLDTSEPDLDRLTRKQ